MPQLRLGYFLCYKGFYLRNGRCEKTVKNCIKFSDKTKQTCTDCEHGFSLFQNICVQNSILGCKEEDNHVCRECYRPFRLVDGDCLIANCKTYNDYKCVACECGFFLTPNGICKRMETGCVRYQRGQCTDCLPNFTLKGSQCKIEGCVQLNDMKCQKCDVDYELFNDGCVMKNCQNWKDGVCQICERGFNMKSGKCVSNKNLQIQ